MQFHTEFSPEALPYRIGLNSQIVTIGSCFAEVMGQRLIDNKLTVLNNPFGTLFNPISIAKLLTMALRGNTPDEDLYCERDGIWFHYDFHSSLWATTQNELRDKLAACLGQTADAIRKADYLFLTLGSAMVYRHIQTGKVVANCHKMPGSLFEKYLYQIDHIRDDLTRLLKTLHKVNAKLKVVLTVSPVRHTRDTLPLNSASKSILRVVTHELAVWNDWITYFPAFEFMMDDLRDYRFYEADLIHPNKQAHDYIFGKFAESAFDPELRSFVTKWAQISRSLAHRPLYTDNSLAHRQFLVKLVAELETLSPCIDVSTELAEVHRRLEKCMMYNE
ncbi:GSCFA domain-containing protein [Spirosoma sp. KCTC 42546]|uniref:GSCFA domain-containing protein n=1 Tax=Spirosoma sp. KCTC 42546 TaxID=2520506 RepID=UPI001157E76F|nr:GSCFA domain-containing protein [Spirosoma sp. KCTC 42546]QDK79909.1 GSCFA domain-containing protein [Spirosoma sp. KCTC 42546]